MSWWKPSFIWKNSNIKKDTSLKNIYDDHLHPELNKKLIKILTEAISSGLNVAVYSSYRSYEEQNKLYNKIPKVTNAKGGFSWHNFGLAFDIVFKTNGKWSWGPEHDWYKLGEIGEKHGMSWGGRWKNFKDMAHFEAKIDKTKSFCRKKMAEGGLKNVWENIKIL